MIDAINKLASRHPKTTVKMEEDEDEDPQELKGDDEFHALNNDLPQPSNSHGPSKLNEPQPESQLEITENVQLQNRTTNKGPTANSNSHTQFPNYGPRY